jgi:hypothetical protein
LTTFGVCFKFLMRYKQFFNNRAYSKDILLTIACCPCFISNDIRIDVMNAFF